MLQLINSLLGMFSDICETAISEKREVEGERELRKGEHGTDFYLVHCLFKPT